ncbi:MAG: dihydropteroate synthase [Planctomycetota bacterium]
MAVLNVTPDSFSDGGRYLDPASAAERAAALVSEGADVLDIGGESTRPGADPVDEAEELRRVLPVIERVRGTTRAPLSIDTMKSRVAREAVLAGASIVNDVSGGLADPAMLGTVAELREGPQARDVHVVLMHRQGEPKTMQEKPSYADPVAEVLDHLRSRALAAEAAGIPRERITLDPGIGFGKRLSHNLALLANLRELRALGYPILLGASRKSFIGHITGAEEQHDWLATERKDVPSERIGGTAAAVTVGVLAGVDVLRVHDVAVMREVMLVAHAIAGSKGGTRGSV